MTYIMDVLEEVGTDVARRCYWDFGDWSDLWRETKHVPLDVSLQVSLRLASRLIPGPAMPSQHAWAMCMICFHFSTDGELTTLALLQTVMSASDDVGKLRWLRCIVELARTACHMCPTSMGVAYLEMLHKLSR